MTSDEHADSVEQIVLALRGRILGVGAEQYDDGSGVQRFERKPIWMIRRDAIEEIDDLIVYLAQIRMRLTDLSIT